MNRLQTKLCRTVVSRPDFTIFPSARVIDGEQAVVNHLQDLSFIHSGEALLRKQRDFYSEYLQSRPPPNEAALARHLESMVKAAFPRASRKSSGMRGQQLLGGRPPVEGRRPGSAEGERAYPPWPQTQER